MDLYVFTFHNDGTLYRALSPLTPEMVQHHGLPTEAVLGQISALLPSMTPDQFEQNGPFVELVHQVIATTAPTLAELQTAAKAQGTGWLPIIDQRAGQVTGEIGREDIFGQFEIRRGEMVPNSYQPNEHYRILTDNGPIQLPDSLEQSVLTAINNLVASS